MQPRKSDLGGQCSPCKQAIVEYVDANRSGLLSSLVGIGDRETREKEREREERHEKRGASFRDIERSPRLRTSFEKPGVGMNFLSLLSPLGTMDILSSLSCSLFIFRSFSSLSISLFLSLIRAEWWYCIRMEGPAPFFPGQIPFGWLHVLICAPRTGRGTRLASRIFPEGGERRYFQAGENTMYGTPVTVAVQHGLGSLWKWTYRVEISLISFGDKLDKCLWGSDRELDYFRKRST